MNRLQIEAWALRLIDAAKSSQPNEDSFAELKSEWPNEAKEIKRAARQIAAHANAAHGEPIIWLIGVDEEKGVTGADKNELANWFPKIQAEFDGVAPELKFVFNVPVDDKMVVALHFETDRAPFVVKNSEGGGHIAYEVPWREGNKTRTAKRADLVRLLTPLQSLPTLEVMSAQVLARPNANPSAGPNNTINWDVTVTLYITPADNRLLTIPNHRCKVSLGLLGNTSFVGFVAPSFIQPTIPGYSDSNRYTNDEMLVYSPGKIIINAQGYSPPVDLEQLDRLKVYLDIMPAGNDRPVALVIELPKTEHDPAHFGRWSENHLYYVSKRVSGGGTEVVAVLE